jgi:hypothetical protein
MPDAKEFGPVDFNVKDGSGSIVSYLTGIHLVFVPNNDGTTHWSLEFNTRNITQDTVGDSYFLIHIHTSTGALLENLVPKDQDPGKRGIFGWRDQCYFGEQGQMERSGDLQRPYANFVELAATMNIIQGAIDRPQGGCR